MEDLFLTIVMPALNEEKNILPALDDTLAAFSEYGIHAEIVVVNDGSTDSTPLLVKKKMQECPAQVRMVEHATAQGIGASFWDGVTHARGNIVCMLPGDNENDPREIIRYLNLLRDCDMVVPFVYNKETRSRFRNFVSFFYRSIINATFFTSLNYTNGTVLYRKSLLTGLGVRSSGFFFQTDILIRLIKQGYLFAEVPYSLRRRKEGKSKAISWRSFKGVVKGYTRLVFDVYCNQNEKNKPFPPDSLSFKRHG
jgi:dolichol-phosphate mannosyltransferase